MAELRGQEETFFWGSIEKRVTKKYWLTLKEKLTTAEEQYHKNEEWGKRVLLLCLLLKVNCLVITTKICIMFIKTLRIFLFCNISLN